MIETIEIDDVKKGDILLLDLEEKMEIITVKRVNARLITIVPEEWGGLDYVPEYPEEIIRLGSESDRPKIIVMAKKITLGLNDYWIDKFQENK